MDQMHEIDLEPNDLRNIYLLPAPLWHSLQANIALMCHII